MSSFRERARSAISNLQNDDRVKEAAAATKEAATRAQEASKNVTRKVTQEDSWDEVRNDVEQLTEISRAHHALIVDLIDRLTAPARPGAPHASRRGSGGALAWVGRDAYQLEAVGAAGRAAVTASANVCSAADRKARLAGEGSSLRQMMAVSS